MNRDKRKPAFLLRRKTAGLTGILVLILVAVFFACKQHPATLEPLATPTAPKNTFNQTMTVDALTRAAILSETPPATVVGDLGWGEVSGSVYNAVTGEPIPGARVRCEHTSYTTPASARCNRAITTDQDGKFIFTDVFFHDTDTINLKVEAAGYDRQEYHQESILTRPTLEAVIYLPPINITPIIQCTPPLCAIGVNEVYYCEGDCPGGCGTTCATYTPAAECAPPPCRPYDSLACPSGDCPGGCGLVCVTPQAVCTPPLCAIGTNEVYYCEGVCPGGCGTTCATHTPTP